MKVFPTNALSNDSTLNTDEAKLGKFSLHLDEIQYIAKLFSRLTFVAYGMKYKKIAIVYTHIYVVKWLIRICDTIVE